ncbi:MAG: response regulator transcription factor [Cyclobacteriaceae bacterium]
MSKKKVDLKKILVVDDEESILELLKYNLIKEGYEVKTAKDGEEGLKKAVAFKPDLILLDVMMPKLDGIETCRMLREIPELEGVLILILTARSEEYSEIAAFQMGADDYIIKPIKPRVLISRISAFFRREVEKETEEDLVEIKDLVIDRISYTVKKSENAIVLPRKEFELLYFLAKNPNKVFNRDSLLKKIWGVDVSVVARTVDVHIRKIREKIGEGYIKTIKGVGYKFED